MLMTSTEEEGEGGRGQNKQPRQGQNRKQECWWNWTANQEESKDSSHRAGKDTGRGQNESSEGLRENYGLNNAFTNR